MSFWTIANCRSRFCRSISEWLSKIGNVSLKAYRALSLFQSFSIAYSMSKIYLFKSSLLISEFSSDISKMFYNSVILFCLLYYLGMLFLFYLVFENKIVIWIKNFLFLLQTIIWIEEFILRFNNICPNIIRVIFFFYR